MGGNKYPIDWVAAFRPFWVRSEYSGESGPASGEASEKPEVMWNPGN